MFRKGPTFADLAHRFPQVPGTVLMIMKMKVAPPPSMNASCEFSWFRVSFIHDVEGFSLPYRRSNVESKVGLPAISLMQTHCPNRKRIRKCKAARSEKLCTSMCHFSKKENARRFFKHQTLLFRTGPQHLLTASCPPVARFAP